MSAIESSTVGVKTMADGTLRITLDIEPRFAKDAFGLFGSPGTSCALAALRTGTEVPHAPEKLKGGPLANLAGQWCNDAKFQAWIAIEYHNFLGDVVPEDFSTPAEFARHCILVMCAVDSRADLDHSLLARDTFDRYIRRKFMAYGGRCPA